MQIYLKEQYKKQSLICIPLFLQLAMKMYRQEYRKSGMEICHVSCANLTSSPGL